MNKPSWFSNIRRSRNGILLGVFKGIADSKGWGVTQTRIGGAFVLIIASGIIGDRDLSRFFIAAFFYLLLAVLIPAELGDDRLPIDSVGDDLVSRVRDRVRDRFEPGGKAKSAAPAPARFTRSDLADLGQQMERLNRRVQRMEGVVTNRSYEWERRIRSENN